MKRSLAATTASLTLIGVAGGAQFIGATADTTSPGGDMARVAHHPPFSGEAPCKSGATIKVRSFYNAHAEHPERVKIRVRAAKPATRLTLTVTIYQGDSGSSIQLHRRTDSRGDASVTLSGASGYHRIDATATSAAGESCELEIAGLLTPLP